MTPEHRAKIALALIGNRNGLGSKRESPMSLERRATLRAANLGKKDSLETRAKKALALRGRKRPPEVVAKVALANTGKRRSLEQRARMSVAHIGHVMSEEQKQQVSKRMRGRIFSEDWRRKISDKLKGNKNCLGRVVSLKTRAEISVTLMGHKHSPETLAKLSKASKGRTHVMPLESRAKMSVDRKGKKTGPDSYAWQGGISMLPYAWSFNKELKAEVRRRDNYKCQLCGVPQAECNETLPVHHIDYDKKNSDPVNLVTLCIGCHARTMVNREYWTVIFKAIMIQRSLVGFQ